MKIRPMSDIHLEFGGLDLRKVDADVLVLAGDIGVKTMGGVWAIDQALKLDVPIVMVAGNHEFYDGWEERGDMKSVYEDLHKLATESNGRFFFLQNETVVIKDVAFIGATLWTDFNLHGDQLLAEMRIHMGMNDYKYITVQPLTKLMPLDTRYAHLESKNFIMDELAKDYPNKVVITHHAPSAKSVADTYKSDSLTPGYASNLDEMMIHLPSDLWIHGHIHENNDYYVGTTRVISNPRGYVGKDHGVNPNFDPNLVVEI